MPYTMTSRCWDIVEAIVKRRHRTLKRYHFFEELWRHLEDDKQLIFLQAPTGAGKTEAVLSPFLYGLINEARNWHSMLYVLPTKSLVHNMFQRFCKTLNACKEEFNKPKRVVIDYDYGGFLPFKAFIEGDITVTTYDTLMYTFYGFRSYGHHIFLSVGKIAGSLIILDEVQLLQDTNWYALSLLPHHIVNLLSFGATVLVISATIPRILIEETLRPIKMYKTSWSYEVVEADPKKDNVLRGKLEVSLNEGFLLNSLFDVIETCEKPVLLVFNTVERAVNAYKQLIEKSRSNVILLHSRLISTIRKERESLFEKRGDMEPSNEDLVVIATQVIEAGVDFNFKTIATEICPIDSLIQRLGHCARKADGYALVFKDIEQTKWVYPEVIVERTLRVLDEQQLADSVQNVQVASGLVNEVYTTEIVKQLKSEVDDYLRGALSFIKTFNSDKIYTLRSIIDSQASNLLRLGIELRCLLLPQELYQEVLALCKKNVGNEVLINCPSEHVAKLLMENTLSLSISVKAIKRHLDIPSLKHKIGEKEYYLLLSVSSQRFEAIEDHSPPEQQIYVLKITMVDDLSKLIRQRAGFTYPLIINPLYYEVSGDGYHLGLVRPYGESS